MKHSFESSLEVGIAQRVQDRVQGGVEVPEPDGNGEDGLVHALVMSAVRDHHKQSEVG